MITKKQKEFNDAMQKYHRVTWYPFTYKFVSFLNTLLQFILLFVFLNLSIDWQYFIFIFVASYFLTDFINGLVHMYMDNNNSYKSVFGPFIASFHLHHKTPTYKNNNIFAIYYNESGAKIWLFFYLLFILYLVTLGINEIVLATLIMIGILSSFAEVSHYLCHNSDSGIVIFFQNIGLLLSMNHHQNHHKEDNVGYAFLNGMSDIFIDKIAKKFYSGYKEDSDKHYEGYEGADSSNRGRQGK